jgi:hypothetical protein
MLVVIDIHIVPEVPEDPLPSRGSLARVGDLCHLTSNLSLTRMRGSQRGERIALRMLKRKVDLEEVDGRFVFFSPFQTL